MACDKSVIGAKELLGRCALLSCSMASVSWEVQLVIVSVGDSCGSATIVGSHVTVSEIRSRCVVHTHVL